MRKEQLQRYLRYARAYLRHATPVKIANLLRTELRLSTNNPGVSAVRPYFLFVDISSGCNLRCPLCQTGRGEASARKNRMTLAHYRTLLHPLRRRLFQVFLYNWGEPFLNRDIYDIIAYNTKENMGTVVSSNFNLPVDPKRLVESGLEHLIISGDGVTQEVYEQYRRGGNIQNVLKNLDALATEKQRAKSRLPHIEWQCLVTRHTEHHLESIRKTALEHGADEVRFANLNSYSIQEDLALADDWLPENPQYRKLVISEKQSFPNNRRRRPCYWLWRTTVINADGGVTPCCLYDTADWGNALDRGFTGIWNNDTYTEARNRSKNRADLIRTSLVCDTCTAPYIYH